MSNTKPGGGNKPQPYIPAGNGEKSGQYTQKGTPTIKDINCYIRDVKGEYNFRNSKLVGKVSVEKSIDAHQSLSPHLIPNFVAKTIIDGYVVSERYYNDEGDVYLDIDYTCHGNPKRHPIVPHIHRWKKNSEGKFYRKEWEDFQ